MKFTTIKDAKLQTGFSYLGTVNSSAKIVKNLKVGQLTYALYLAPAMTSGYNVCPNATTECKAGCLNTSGRAKVELYTNNSSRIINARINKTKLFFENHEFFMDWLIAELKYYAAKAEKMGLKFSARLNATSDIDWQETGIFDMFPNVEFYDYTKNPTKFVNIAKNYHLTFSYTGYNWPMAKKLLDRGFSIAVVFNVKKVTDLPTKFKGYNVLNGDETDYRPNDLKGSIIGLKWKTIANKENNEFVRFSNFVVQPENQDCEYSKITTKAKVLI